MLLLIPKLFRNGARFEVSLVLGCALTIARYLPDMLWTALRPTPVMSLFHPVTRPFGGEGFEIFSDQDDGSGVFFFCDLTPIFRSVASPRFPAAVAKAVPDTVAVKRKCLRAIVPQGQT